MGSNIFTIGSYDRRNLPLSIRTSSGTFNYFYDEQGNRIIKKSSTSTEYYVSDYTGRVLAIYDLAEVNNPVKMVNLYGNGLIGRVNVDSTGYHKFYYLKDHLGNIRQTWNSNEVIVAAQDYYSYGDILRSYNAGTTFEIYKFTGKERDSESNLDYYGARYYESGIGRWLSVDPMRDKYPGWSPYNYCLDNPERFIDPDGADLGWYDDGTGKPIFRADIHSQADLNIRGIKGNYVDEQFVRVDTKSNTEILYGIDGTTSAILPQMPDVTVSGKDNSGGNKFINGVNTVIAATGASVGVMEGVLKLDKGVEVAAPVFSNTMKGIGKTLGYTAAVISAAKLKNHPSWTNATELGINVGLSVLDASDPYTLGVSIGLGVMSATGLDDKVLNKLYNEK